MVSFPLSATFSGTRPGLWNRHNGAYERYRPVLAMSIDVTAEVQITRPRGDVAAYLFDPANDPEWIGGVREAQLLGEPPIAAGSRVRRVAKFLGRRIEYVNEVVAIDAGSRLHMRSVAGPFPMDIEYSLADAGDATVFRNRVQGDASGFFRIASPAMAPMVKRSIQKDAERLRDVLERR